MEIFADKGLMRYCDSLSWEVPLQGVFGGKNLFTGSGGFKRFEDHLLRTRAAIKFD